MSSATHAHLAITTALGRTWWKCTAPTLLCASVQSPRPRCSKFCKFNVVF